MKKIAVTAVCASMFLVPYVFADTGGPTAGAPTVTAPGSARHARAAVHNHHKAACRGEARTQGLKGTAEARFMKDCLAKKPETKARTERM